MQFEHLNDDCLEHIFQYLNLEQQLTVMHLQNFRFNRIIEEMWRRKYKKKVIWLVCNTAADAAPTLSRDGISYFYCYLNNLQDFDAFVNVNANRVYMLTLKQAEQLDCLENLVLRNVNWLEMYIKKNFRKTINISEMFPTLEVLKIDWEDDEKNVEYVDFPQWNLRQSMLALAFNKTIVDLTLVEDLLELIIQQTVLNMSSLRRISATYSRRHSRYLLTQISLHWKLLHQVHTLALNFVSTGYCEPLEAIMKFKNTRIIYLIASLNTMEYYRVPLVRILTEMPCLRELHYGYDVNLVKVSDDLKRGMIYDFVKFAAYIITCQEQSRQRTRSLKLFCYGPQLLDYFDPDMFNIPRLLRVTFYPINPIDFPIDIKLSFFCDAQDLDSIDM